MTFDIKSKQRGRIEECMPDLPFSTLRMPQHVECYFDCFRFFPASVWQKDRLFFLKNRFIDQAPAARLYNPTLMYFLNGNPHLFIFTVWSLYLGLCVNEDVFISTGTFDPIFVVHRQTAEVNNIIELMSYTPLSAVHSHGQPEAWRLSASYTSYCMFDEYLEGRIW